MDLIFVYMLFLLESLVMGFLFLLTFMGFPQWIKIALSRIKGKQYIIKLTRDNALIIQGAREIEGVYKTPNGIYELEPEDTFSFNGCTAGLWFAPYNRAVYAKVMPLLQDLKKAGIDNYGQLMYFYNTSIEEIREKSGEKAAETAQIIQSYEGRILQDLEVIRISDLKNFLESRSPSAENGIIERYVNIERRKLGNPLKNSNVVMFIVMAALLGLCLGYIMHGSGTGAEHPALNAMSNAANAAGTLTQKS